MEILAPAGNREALERAQAAGADAVYLGYADFSARSGAGNFTAEELADAIRFAHLHHMRVYVTVNTLVKDDEMDRAEALLGLLERLDADGVLVQDLGILRTAREKFPGLNLHASTQMAIHNATGVRWCGRMGMGRVVLARECALEEIRRCAATGMEIEVFAHGAQCVAVSGECLFSSMAGERSGNRGRCAQPCRKMYWMDGRKGAWLSPRDLCLRDDLPALAEAGAASLKIEGRLKRPEYVFTVTDSYRRAADALARGGFQAAGPEEREALLQIFHRGGFMRGYAFGAEDAGVIQPESVNHRGVRIGTVEEIRGGLCQVRLEKSLGDGDGLRIIHGDAEGEMTYAGPDRPAGELAALRLREGLRAGPGDAVFRLTDAARLAAAMAAPKRTIPVGMELEAWPGAPLRLRVTDGENEAVAAGEPVEAARNRETTAAEMEKQLARTGGTDFTAERIRVRTAGTFVPVSALNALRREALVRLAEARILAFARETLKNPEPESAGKGWSASGTNPEAAAGMAAAEAESLFPKGLLVTVRNPEQAEAARAAGGTVIWYPEDFRAEALSRLAREIRREEWLRLPETCEEDTLLALRDFAAAHRDRLAGILLGSVGQLGADWPVPVAAGPGVPVMNRKAALLLREQGCRFAFASPELTGREMAALRENSPIPLAAPVYGRAQLMLLHHCPARTALGLREGHSACAFCDTGHPDGLRGKKLRDAEGRAFPLLRLRLPEGCLVRLMNMLPTDLGDKPIPAPRAAEMTTESGPEAAEALACLLRGEKAPGESTRGHWQRPVL